MAGRKVFEPGSSDVARMLVASAILLTVAACGNPDSESSNVEADLAAVSEHSSSSPPAEIPPIEVFEFTVQGVAPQVPVPGASQLILSGGCAAPSPMSIGFTSGTPNSGEYFGLAIESAEPVAQGRTGEVALSRITWDNGASAPKNLPDSNFKVPNRFEGAGTLVIAAHTGRGMGGSMSGSVSGQVRQRGSDEVAQIALSFVINLACAN